jgi:hypothetical protein
MANILLVMRKSPPGRGRGQGMAGLEGTKTYGQNLRLGISDPFNVLY